MKKATLSLTTLAALTVTTVALGDEPNRMGGPTSAPPSSSVTQPTPVIVIAPQAATPQAPPAGMAPQPGSAPATAPCPVATTTITSAEIVPMTPPPPRDTITVKQTSRPHRPLLYTGSSMLVSTYAATAAVTAIRDVRDGNKDQTLYIPVAGPWLHLRTSSEGMLDKSLIIGSGVAQGVGAFLSVLSLIVPEKVPAATIQAGGVKVHITASSPGKGAAGIGAGGTF